MPGRATSLSLVGLVLFLVVFAYLELTYTRRVDGTSMLPTLEPGDLVVVQTVPFSNLAVGDIIVYGSPCSISESSVIHRVVQVTGTGVITKGDNNPYQDPGPISRGTITSDCYIGKVVFVVPYVERVALLPYGTNYVLALLILLAIVYLELKGRKGKDEQEARTPQSNIGNK